MKKTPKKEVDDEVKSKFNETVDKIMKDDGDVVEFSGDDI